MASLSPSSRPPLSGALHRYVEARGAALTSARHQLGVNELDARALLHIDAHAGTRPGDLREYLGITSAGVTTLIDRLVERGAVRRDIDADDRRVSRLTTTADLHTEPWSVLTRFDDAFAAAIAAAKIPDAERLADVLDGFTSTAALAVS